MPSILTPAQLIPLCADAAPVPVPEAGVGVTLGRGAECALRGDHLTLSTQHCRVRRDGDAWVVEDLGSRNGTFVNGERVQRQVLKDGDTIQCGILNALGARFALRPAPVPEADPGRQGQEGAQAGGSTKVIVEQEEVEVKVKEEAPSPLIAELAAAQAALREAEAQRDQARAEVERLTRLREALAERLRSSEEAQGELHRVRVELEHEREALRADLRTSKELIAEAMRQRNEAQEALKGESRARIDLEQQLHARRGEQEALEREVRLLRQRNEDLLGKAGEAELARRLREQVEDNERLRQVIQQSNLERERAKLALSEVQAKLDAGKQTEAGLLKQVNDLRAERDLLKDTVRERRLALEKTEDLLRQERAQNEKLQRAVESGGAGAERLASLLQRIGELEVVVARSASLREKVGVLYEDMKEMLRAASERAGALQHGHEQEQGAATGREALSGLIEEVVEQIRSAQGNLRGLGRLLGE